MKSNSPTSLDTAILEREPLTPVSGVNRICFSADGQFMASAALGMNVRVYQRNVPVYEAHFDGKNPKGRAFERIRGLGFSPEGEMLYVAAGDKVHQVHWESNEILWSYRAPKAFGFLIVPPICLATTDSLLVAAFENGKVLSWAQDGGLVCAWSDNEAPHMMTALSRNRVLGSDGHAICIWDVQTGRKEVRVVLPERAYAIAGNEEFAVMRSLGGAYLVDLTSAKVGARLPVSSGLPLVDVSRRGMIALGTHDGVQILGPDGAFYGDLSFEGSRALSLKFHPNGRQIAVGRPDDRVDLLDLPGSSAGPV